MSEVAEQQSIGWPVVQTDAGPVTLASVTDLQARAGQLRDWAAKSTVTAQSLRTQADLQFAAAGSTLIAHSTEWAVPVDLQPKIERARALTDQVASDDQQTVALKGEESSAGMFGRIGVRHHEHLLEADRNKAGAQLHELLAPIARSAPPNTIPEADQQRNGASDLESQAGQIEVQVQSAQASAKACDDEVVHRQEVIKAMGFDSLYEAARLKTSGAQAVDSPLILKAGEQAYLSVPATLARMTTRTHYAGRSSGFSFPIGHTGIRYRVGSFRGAPVQQQSLTKLDTGTFVLTNKRLAYVGQTKSTSVALDKLMHFEIYNDALSVAREGKENPDFYLMSNPKYAAFLVNWVLASTPPHKDEIPDVS